MSEGGLEHLSWWYIPESGIHHQPKLTRQGPPGSAFRRRIAAAPPGPHDRSGRLTCGNDDRGQPESSCQARPGPDGGIRTAALHHLAGMVAASRCCPEVPAPKPQPPRTSPDDLAAELNPHKTELNPHKAVEAASRARTDQTGLPSSGQSPPARQLAKAEPSRRPRSAVPMTLRYRHGPSLRTRSRRSSSLDLRVFAVAAAGVLCAFSCVVDALPEQCLRYRPGANPLFAAVFRTERLLRECCSATMSTPQTSWSGAA